MPVLTHENLEISYTLKRTRRRRSLMVRVEPSGTVTVLAPHYALKYFIQKFVQERAGWIREKLLEFEAYRKAHPPIPEAERRQLRERQTQETERRLRDILPLWAMRMGVTPGHIKVVEQKKRWASCSPTGNLRFNWRLSMMPESILEYVIVHELAHLRAHNHSRTFWAIVQATLPDFKSRRRWLRENSLHLNV